MWSLIRSIADDTALIAKFPTDISKTIRRLKRKLSEIVSYEFRVLPYALNDKMSMFGNLCFVTMALPPKFNDLVQKIEIELNELNSILIQSIRIVRERINLFPENIILMQLYSNLNNYALFAQNTQRRTQETIQYLVVNENMTEENIQEFGEDLSEQLGRIIEAKIVVNTVQNRLER